MANESQKKAMATQLLLLRGGISVMKTMDQLKIHECHDKLAKIVDEYGLNGFLGLSLLSTERALEEARKMNETGSGPVLSDNSESRKP